MKLKLYPQVCGLFLAVLDVGNKRYARVESSRKEAVEYVFSEAKGDMKHAQALR